MSIFGDLWLIISAINLPVFGPDVIPMCWCPNAV